MKKSIAELRHALDLVDPSLPHLRQQRSELIGQARALVDRASNQDRDFTDVERQEYRRLMGADETGTRDGVIGKLSLVVKAQEALENTNLKKNSAAVLRSAGLMMKRSELEKLSARARMAWFRAGGKLVDG